MRTAQTQTPRREGGTGGRETHPDLERQRRRVLLGELDRPTRTRRTHVAELDLGLEDLVADVALPRDGPLGLDAVPLEELVQVEQRRVGVLERVERGLGRAPARVVVRDDGGEAPTDPGPRRLRAVLDLDAREVGAEERRAHVGVGGDGVEGDWVGPQVRDKVVAEGEVGQDVGAQENSTCALWGEQCASGTRVRGGQGQAGTTHLEVARRDGWDLVDEELLDSVVEQSATEDLRAAFERGVSRSST